MSLARHATKYEGADSVASLEIFRNKPDRIGSFLHHNKKTSGHKDHINTPLYT